MKFNNSGELFEVAVHKTEKRYLVVPRYGRFLVCRKLFGLKDTFDVVDDCRTEAYAKMRADFLNIQVDESSPCPLLSW